MKNNGRRRSEESVRRNRKKEIPETQECFLEMFSSSQRISLNNFSSHGNGVERASQAAMKEKILWRALSFLRVMWCLAPQKGYLHPDEFFQSPEVIAGDILDLEINRPWEFQSAFPCRTVLIPLLTSGTAFWIINIFHRFCSETAFSHSYILLVLPRLIITILSFVLDYTVHQVAAAWGSNPWKALVLLAMSPVTLVFYTRTFSNAVEGVLFALLLLLISTGKSNPVTKPWKVKSHHLIGLVLTAGFFNRPTFLCFAFMPIIYWAAQSGSPRSHFSHTSTVLTVMKTIPSTVLCSVIFILADTIYYTGHWPLSMNKKEGFIEQLKNNTILTPINFLQYNMNPENLAQHGVHPRITHITVNGVMLFGLFHLSAVCSGINMLKNMIRSQYTYEKPFPQQSVTSLLLMFYFVPILFMSIFNHQEPRFLIPLIVPLVLIVSNSNRTIKTKCVIVLFNVTGALFFGCLHQAGLIPGLFHIRQIVQTKSISGNMSNHHTVVFTHTYMPPLHLLNLKKGQRSVDIIDLAGCPEDLMCQKLRDIQEELSFRNAQAMGRTVHHFIAVFPGTITSVVESCRLAHKAEALFTPHLSMEDPPKISHLLTGNLKSQLSIHVVEIDVDSRG
ncbi:GPI mannosyltransferase 4 isoform X3 [Hyla sarda]|uniref:GPI mannosyltransferase 4 isoform X3 n=1 Tax=Hyla sarda TaxID=327740 RepID=UPI0024C22DDB|nr:GPI mannosyltransferase 4 isoform X3 [Hyla sarda]